MNKITKLETRSIIEVAGHDRKKFLQGLLTNDVNKANEKNLIFSVMLNPQGRFLYDFFIFENEEKLLLDCPDFRRDEILQKLNFYKLRSQVELKKNDDLFVAQSFENVGFVDPRHKNLGQRIYLKKSEEKSFIFEDCSKYHLTRIKNKIAEGEFDLTYEKSFILEFGFDDLNAIDYQKGCYVGQELTARTHYRGEIRKKLFYVQVGNIKSQNSAEELNQNLKLFTPFKNSEITCEGKSAGIILSSIMLGETLHALALIKISENEKIEDFSEKLIFEGNKISIIS